MKDVIIEKVIQYIEWYSVLFSNDNSHTIVVIWDEMAGKKRYAEYQGVNDLRGFLPGGALYLADTWTEAIEELKKRYYEHEYESKEQWNQPNTNGELPGDICCQIATGGKCYEHNPNNYFNGQLKLL